MRRLTFFSAIFLLTLAIGLTLSVLWPADPVPWPLLDTLCGVSDIQNPLCKYSPDLREIPTVDFCDLVRNPQVYDGKTIRIRGNFVPEDVDSYNANAYLENPECGSDNEQIGVAYWDGHTIQKLMDYLVFAPGSHRADVVVVGEFEVAKHRNEALDNERLFFLILRTEKMSLVAPVPPNNPFNPTAQ